MFALYFDAATRRITALNGSGRAPQALTLERLRREGLLTDSLPPFHPYTITVPGACAGWCDLIERHGSLPLAEVLAPAIRLAEEGFPVAPITAYFWSRGAERQLRSAWNGAELLVDGRAPQPGEIFRNPGLARTLRTVAEGGKTAFYQGSIAEAIVEAIRDAGGCMTLSDLAAHTSTWEEPISVVYRGLRVYECPPNGQGLVTLMALNILEGIDLGRLELLSPLRLHWMIEALRLAFADAQRYIADPRFASVPVDDLLSDKYAAERRALLRSDQALEHPHWGKPVDSTSDTVYLSVVDRFGNACSLINSNYMGFGTGIVPKGWGFSLHNRGHNFSLEAGHPNVLAPGKRPYHTLIPAMVTRDADGSLYASFGVMGGFMQPQGQVQVLSAMVDAGLDPQAALDLPRFCIQVERRPWLIALEEGMPHSTLKALQKIGHSIQPVSGYARALFGRGQVILRDFLSGVLCAGSDPRADGCAMPLL